MDVTSYTIVNQNDEFVYFDLGDLKYDKKMPRRSGTTNDKREAHELLAKTERVRAKNIAELETMLKRSNPPSIVERLKDGIQELKDEKFHIVVMTMKDL